MCHLNRKCEVITLFEVFIYHSSSKMDKLMLPCEVNVTGTIQPDADIDGCILVTESIDVIPNALQEMKDAIAKQKTFDAVVGKEVTFIAVPTASPGDSKVVFSPGYSKVVFSPTGPTNRDYDDHRNFADAAGAGIKRAIVAGMRKPLLIVCPSPDYPNAMLAAALGALHAAYVVS
nr:uncharacterized protein LOC129272690 [Lytechinus pictus]